MKRGLQVLLPLCLLPAAVCLAQQQPTPGPRALGARDSTTQWHYPYQATTEHRQRMVEVLRAFRDSCTVQDLVRQLGEPAVVEQLSEQTRGLSARDAGFLSGLLFGAHKRVSSRLVWFAKKEQRLPSETDVFLAAYVRPDGLTVRALTSNGLD